MEQIQSMDWGAIAAWIALVISIIGTIVGPIVTTSLTNRHQLKLREIDIKHENLDKYNSARLNAINTFISNVGEYLSRPDTQTLRVLGSSYLNIYPYVPQKLWKQIDHLYASIISGDMNIVHNKFLKLVHDLAELLQELPQ